MTKPYKDGTSLKQIIRDGWARGFCWTQTIEEAQAMGFTLSREDLKSAWAAFDKELDAYHEGDESV